MSSTDSFVSPTYSVGEIHCPGCNCGSGYPSDEAMAAIAAACTCAPCMTGGKCVDDPERWDEDDVWEANCGFCPDDCQICSGTPHCDCPTHGGHDAA